MKTKTKFFVAALAAVALPLGAFSAMRALGSSAPVAERPEGPCDVYAKGGAPCVAAHSTTRALYAEYDGPLYQVTRKSDGATLDIGVVGPNQIDGGGYADAPAQDEFCRDTYCWITVIYDQSGYENHLIQAPRGGFLGTALGGADQVPVADWAPVTVMGHKVYGVFIAPGMGMRALDTNNIAVDDQAEGQYWVINGHHYNSGCCYDYGNGETDSRDDGDGTMETTYYGNSSLWYYGEGAGPWIMTDQENNLVGCVNPSPNDKYCPDIPSISWRFVTATADGEPHHWRSMGGDAQQGDLVTMFDGPRIINDRNSYDPMRKQGSIILGNGGDNGNVSQGTFYEGAMTAPGTFPSIETNQALQANIVAAGYDVPTLTLSASDKIDAPAAVQTFALGGVENSSIKFVNTTGKTINNLTLTIEAPRGWKVKAYESDSAVKTIDYPVEPGQTVIVDFSVTSSSVAFEGDLRAKAEWKDGSRDVKEYSIMKARNNSPIKINEFRVADDKGNMTNSFIELYNDSDETVDISDWNITQHAIWQPIFSKILIPSGTTIAPKSFYLLGLANSGLAVDAAKGDNVIYVRDVKGIKVGDVVEIGSGANVEKRKVTKVIAPETPQQPVTMRRGRSSAPGTPTTIWQPLPEGPYITIPAGSKNIPVTSVDHMKVGQKLAIGYGSKFPNMTMEEEKYEVVTITKVGKPGTQAWLSMDAKPGDRNLKVSSVENISVGDKIRLDIDSQGHGVEWVTVKKVGTASSRSTFMGPLGPNDDPGTGIEIKERLKYHHASNMPFSVNGSGVSFEPATKFDHTSNEPVLALVFALELDSPLSNDHKIDEVVYDANVTTAGYQDKVKADQLFGGPALSPHAASIVLYDDKGLVADAVNYGRIVDPWVSEGYHGESGFNKFGNNAKTPYISGTDGYSNPAASDAIVNISAGRYPDGADNDDNIVDFKVQNFVNLAAPAVKGDKNIKVLSVEGIKPGQVLHIGKSGRTESAIVGSVGTAGSTVLTSDVAAGSKVVKVQSAQNFVVGQNIEIGGKRAVIAEITRAPRGFFMRPAAGGDASDTITLASPLTQSYSKGERLSGTGILLATPLVNNHEAGDPVIDNAPTPGRPNKF